MALEGSLKEFSLADILQLLFFQKKTGALELTGRLDKVRLMFHEGNIVGAESRKRDAENRLGRVLVKRGIISSQQVEAVIARQREEGGKFGSVLVRGGYATPDEIKDVITFQITETLVQLFSWKEGRYEFKPMRIPIDREIGVELNTEHFLMEGVRLVDEWSEIKDKINIDTVFLPRQVSAPVDLSEDEQRVMRAVDGENDVGNIADITGIDSFQVSVILLGLKEKGLVSKLIVEEAEEGEEIALPPARSIPGLSMFLWLLVILALGASVYLFIMSPSNRKTADAWEDISVIGTNIKTQYYLNGKYPASISQTDAWGNPYSYAASASGFSIRSAGPDGKIGTTDDIR
jgi:hypothetical protein